MAETLAQPLTGLWMLTLYWKKKKKITFNKSKQQREGEGKEEEDKKIWSSQFSDRTSNINFSQSHAVGVASNELRAVSLPLVFLIWTLHTLNVCLHDRNLSEFYKGFKKNHRVTEVGRYLEIISAIPLLRADLDRAGWSGACQLSFICLRGCKLGHSSWV